MRRQVDVFACDMSRLSEFWRQKMDQWRGLDRPRKGSELKGPERSEQLWSLCQSRCTSIDISFVAFLSNDNERT